MSNETARQAGTPFFSTQTSKFRENLNQDVIAMKRSIPFHRATSCSGAAFIAATGLACPGIAGSSSCWNDNFQQTNSNMKIVYRRPTQDVGKSVRFASTTRNL
jgi:hypothetical protein